MLEQEEEQPSQGCAAEQQEGSTCPECEVVFRDHNAMACHRRAKHGYRRCLPRAVIGTHCPVCKWDYHSRTRAIAHLERCGACRIVFEAGGCPVYAQDNPVLMAAIEQENSRVRECRASGAHPRLGPAPLPPAAEEDPY